ncbi:hypothetical protein WH95_08225 [Kiloniella litopenaei]|uniref:UPF0145 protein WH95_08225 n=1 Tax=Kiloniella litopenaei TaxID=1549748 RepID=A0A0M2R5U0_9PROT|nr:YbjQ family protein [Kiloniella litopenaei]KKJ77061.1 hypothetical protein WH95_08225 [Kiloniella litopenaei]
MQIVTTDSIEGKRIVAYKGIVSGDAIVGANFVKDFFAKVTDVLGGRAGGYEKALRGAKNHAMDDMIEQAEEVGANAVIGVDLDYESIGGSMLMVSVNGTAVVLEDA